MTPESKPVLDLSALKDIPGRSFFYPCAGEDWNEIFLAFADHFDSFTFVDICYQFESPKNIRIPGWKRLTDQSTLVGPKQDAMRLIEDGTSSYRDITPAWYREKFISDAGRTIEVTRRRGFGQFALDELPDGSLGVFCHCGDSPGDGGSNAWYLANLKRSFPVLSKLFEKVKQKLAYPALIVSDGSLSSIRHLTRPTGTPKGSDFSQHGIVPFSHFGLDWQPVGELMGHPGDERRRIIWRVHPSRGK